MVRAVDNVCVELENRKNVDEVQVTLNGPEDRKIVLTYFRSILALINALGEYLYRNDAKKNHAFEIQTAWRNVREHSAKAQEATKEMVQVWESMEKSETRFFKLLLRDDANSNSG